MGHRGSEDAMDQKCNELGCRDCMDAGYSLQDTGECERDDYVARCDQERERAPRAVSVTVARLTMITVTVL